MSRSDPRAKVPGTVWVVHCVDTEGPLEEPLDATFHRINQRYGLSLTPSFETLRRLQAQAIDLGGKEALVADFVAPSRLAYLSTWRELEEMVSRVTSPEIRNRYRDGEGNPYIFSWFIVDVVGYRDNPRRKAAGYHTVWDHYQRLLRNSCHLDCLGWHFHTVPVGGHALEYNSSWTNNDHHERVLARRMLERHSFPALFRAGGTIERNDLSHWLEQFIPFDYSCCSVAGAGGRPGLMWDWRDAPTDWFPYHPDWYDYRRAGAMKRHLFRCIEISGYESCLSVDDVNEAFRVAASGRDVVLAYTNHDRRDMEPDMKRAVELIGGVAKEWSGVSWRFANAIEAAQRVLGLASTPPPKFTFRTEGSVVWIESDRPLFGSIPFLTVEEEGEVFFRDNPTMEGANRWAYIPPRPHRTRRIGVAGSVACGATSMSILEWKGERSANR